jgi:putative hemolysin
MSVSNAPRSTVSPASSAISSVRSIGKPYVSCSRNASAPPIPVAPDAFAAAIEASRFSEPAASVRRNVASSARAYCEMRA